MPGLDEPTDEQFELLISSNPNILWEQVRHLWALKDAYERGDYEQQRREWDAFLKLAEEDIFERMEISGVDVLELVPAASEERGQERH